MQYKILMVLELATIIKIIILNLQSLSVRGKELSIRNQSKDQKTIINVDNLQINCYFITWSRKALLVIFLNKVQPFLVSMDILLKFSTLLKRRTDIKILGEDNEELNAKQMFIMGSVPKTTLATFIRFLKYGDTRITLSLISYVLLR